jgi:peroxiredoxin
MTTVRRRVPAAGDRTDLTWGRSQAMKHGMWFAVVALAAALLAAGCAKKDTATTECDPDPEKCGKVCGEGTCGQGANVGIDVGQTPPAFTLKDIAGNDVSLSDFEGKVVVLDIWATWCPPCRQEIPFLVALHEEFGAQGLAVVGVGMDEGGADALRPFAEANKMTYPVLVGDKAVGEAYKVTSIPTTFVIGRDGAIVSKHVGFSPAIGTAIREEIAKLVQGAAQAV